MLFKYKYIDFDFDFIYNIYTKIKRGGKNMSKTDKSKENKDSKKQTSTTTASKPKENKNSEKKPTTITSKPKENKDSKSPKNKNDEKKPFTNAGKAKELLKSVIGNEGIQGIKKNGFNFDYNDQDLPKKFKKIFGKDGVIDLLADAWMTEDSTSYRSYSFADMRNDLKFYYRGLKFKNYEVNNPINTKQKEKIEELKEYMNSYLNTCKPEIDNYIKERKKEKDKYKTVKKVTSLIKEAGDSIFMVGAYTFMLPVSQAGIVVKNFGEAIKKLQELYTIIKLDSSKSRRKKRIKDMTKIYKNYRYLCEDLNKNSLVITRYDKDSLKKFSQECKNISDKYKAKVNKFKIWSKELSKQKEIVKYGLQNLMNENTNNDPSTKVAQ